ncbi:dihydroorotase [Allopseudospirillum japonicum]|uniref:Dihydroorotase n=1 Tax=Allopseudospirillum japonicum TaxID=64971 RepID=A0A1H6S8J7_9GAMM|nr:dihydroorotase [Allopseudospirillum japonicum]SEI63116.1 dihydroorotase [Allopseudospirillum japonicum]
MSEATKISIIGARVLDPTQHLDACLDVHLDQGRILALGDAPAHFIPERTLDASGLLLTPGWIDIGTHVREPGPSYKGQLASELPAAAAGGFTHVCARPDTQPVLDSPALVRTLRDKAAGIQGARFLPMGALTRDLQGQALTNMAGLQDAGCIALSQMHYGFQDVGILKRCLEYAATFDLLVCLQPQDPALASKGCAHEGAVATRMGLAGIPETAETLALANILLLVEATGARVHLQHISCARSVDMLYQAQERGLAVTADVSIQHLMYSEHDLENFNTLFHVQPPLRTLQDQAALRQGLQDGVLQVLSSGHLPQDAAAKNAPFAASEAGVSSLETLASQGLALVNQGVLTLNQLIERLTYAPACVLGLDAGHLHLGANADFCLLDPDAHWQVTPASLVSMGKNTPLLGQELTGRIVSTWVQGREVFSRLA